MKVLLDECLPVDLRHLLVGHDVFTVRFMGWTGVKNGALLARAAGDGFDCFVTTDKSIRHQQNLAALPVAIVLLRAASSQMPDLTPLVPRLLRLLDNLPRNTVSEVS